MYNNSFFKSPTSNRGQQSNNFRGQYTNNFREPHANNFREPHANNFREQHVNNEYLHDLSQTRQRNYGQMGVSQFQHNQYRPVNYPQPQNNFEPTSGYPQRIYSSQRDRGNTQRNQNPNHSHQEKTVRYQDDYKNYICPGCSQHFDFSTGRNNRYFGRVPLILNCEHTVCQECIRKVDVGNTIACPVCQIPSELSKDVHNPEEAFVPNFFILGLIAWAKPPGNQLMFVSQTTSKHRKPSYTEQLDPPEPEGEKCGFLSCYERAVLRCQDCNDVFCADCCTMVHKNVKSMWSHVQVQITNGNFSAELEKCSEHGGMDIEFYCNTCDTGTCCYCFIDKHEGHEKEYLSKLSREELNELHIYKKKAEQVLKQLLVSKRKLKDTYNGDASLMEKKIYSYFTDLHGRLHLSQKKLLKELSGQSVNHSNNNVAKLISNVDNSIKTWRNVLVSTDNINTKKINLRGILQKLKDVELTPCYLLNEASNDSNFAEFSPSPILENLSDLFEIKSSNDYSLQLVTEDNLPPDYVKDTVDLHELDIYGSNSSHGAHSSKKEESNLYNKKISSQSGSGQYKTKNSGQNHRRKVDKRAIRDNELVEVTHIESLECFYVQLKKHQSIFAQMNKDIENYVKMGANQVTTPQINELYLAMYVTKTEKIWCRGRLSEIKDQGTIPLYEVYFIDFGSTRTVDINKLREITPHLAQKKPFAIQCELYNPTFTNWSKNAHVYMGKIINGKEIYMVVKNVNNGVYVVDLMISSSDRGLTSIIDMLIYTCTNVLSSSNDSLNSIDRKSSYVPELKIFSNSFKFHKNQSEKVILANVVDPHNIFVHIASYIDLLRAMISELKQYYKNKNCENCMPIEGSYVVVEHKDPVRGNWHRALVKRVDVLQGKAHVLLVDWGNIVIVPWSSLRLLTENFTRLESQAILVKLAHIEPYQGRAWSESAIFFLQKNFRTQDPLKMTVHCVDPLEVALFEIMDSVNICINAQLVQEKYADSTGKISTTLEWPEYDQEHPEPLDEEEGFVASLLRKIDESSDDDSQDQDEAEAYMQPINIVKTVSPDLIYLKFVHLEQQEENLFKELQVHYNKDKKTKETWNENESCVVQLPSCFARGQIICKIEDKYKVNLFDRAEEMVLPKEKLFIYSDYFKKFPKLVFKSHLANIRPAGGDKWSLSSTEALENIFEKHKEMFATKIPGDPRKRSIPMLMWYTRIKTVDALEPSITKYVSVNKLLVRLGFAYKEANATVSINEVTSEDLNESNSEVATDKLDESLESGASEAEMLKEKSSVVSSEKEHTTSSSTDWNQLVEEEQRSSDSKQDSPYHTRETEITDWIPAFPIEKREFNAWITCAETEGILYLRDEDFQLVYKEMENNLKQYFDNQPASVESSNWQPGQICTISYKDYWYRGKIMKINSPTEIVAVMVDFGSDHTLSPKQLYREILYPEIPAFASKIKLDKIYPKSGEWLTSDYDTLLDVVTEFAKVVIKGPLDVEIPLAEVYDDKGQSINNLVVKFCPNLSRHPAENSEVSDEEPAIIEEEEDIEDLEEIIESQIDTTSLEFNVEPLPEEGFKDKILMHIVGVLAYNKVVLKKIEENYEDLLSLNLDIQKSYSTQPHIEDLSVGVPCICPYSEDGLWYRATIHSIEGIDCGYVFVFFVDFGNMESVPTKNIKTMKPKWFELPVSCYIANVNIELKIEKNLEHVMQYMKKSFTKNKLIHFVSNDPLTVDLYETNGELYYQSLINNGLLKLK